MFAGVCDPPLDEWIPLFQLLKTLKTKLSPSLFAGEILMKFFVLFCVLAGCAVCRRKNICFFTLSSSVTRSDNKKMLVSFSCSSASLDTFAYFCTHDDVEEKSIFLNIFSRRNSSHTHDTWTFTRMSLFPFSRSLGFWTSSATYEHDAAVEFIRIRLIFMNNLCWQSCSV